MMLVREHAEGDAMQFAETRFTRHAIQRMFERDISQAVVHEVMASGDVIAEYPDERPYPALLLLGFSGGVPLHVVIAVDRDADTCHVVTVYEPDPSLWQPDFRTRRPLL